MRRARYLLTIFFVFALYRIEASAQAAPVCNLTIWPNPIVAGGALDAQSAAQLIEQAKKYQDYKACTAEAALVLTLSDLLAAQQRWQMKDSHSVDVSGLIKETKQKQDRVRKKPGEWLQQMKSVCDDGKTGRINSEERCAYCLVGSMKEESAEAKQFAAPLSTTVLDAEINRLQQILQSANAKFDEDICFSEQIVVANKNSKTVSGSAKTKLEKEKAKEIVEDTGLDLINSAPGWMANLHLGYSFMPEYSEEGDNEGFTEANVFGRFSVDSRKEMKPKEIFGTINLDLGGYVDYYALHMGANVDMFSSHIVDCEKAEDAEDAEDTTGDDPMDQNDPPQQSGEEVLASNSMDTDPMADNSMEEENCGKEPGDLKFNDIAQSMNASAYIWLHAHVSRWFSPGTEIGLGYRAAVQNREKLGDNDDSLDKIHSVGVRLVYNEYVTQLSEGKRLFKNGMPKFIIEVNRADYENYAGIEDYDRKRTVITMAYRVTDKRPTYIGAYVNNGRGPDEIALTLSYGFDLEKWVEAAF